MIWLKNVSGAVHCMASNRTSLAIGFGNSVMLVRQGTPSAWDDLKILPDPPSFPEFDIALPNPSARSLHFLPEDNILLVTYLDHGIAAWNIASLELRWHIRPQSCKIGASSASPRGDSLATTNLYDGIDWYSLQKPRYTQSSFTHTTILGIRENIILPIIHIHDSSAVLSGGSDGSARIIHTRSGETLQVLEHGSRDIV